MDDGDRRGPIVLSSALTVLSLMEGHAGMPDPVPVRRQVARLLSAMEQPRG